MAKVDELKALEEEIAKADLPLVPANLVFGEGNPGAEVMFIGEAPGYNEDVERRPFVGRAGQLLRKTLRDIGWKEEEVYITNIVKRRPPDNRDPLPEEIEAYKPYLARQIEIINPKIIVPLGRFSMNYFLPFAKITRDQGRVFESEGRMIYPVFHPAAALRATSVLEDFRQSLFNLVKVIAERDAPPPEEEDTPLEENPPEPSPAQSSLF